MQGTLFGIVCTQSSEVLSNNTTYLDLWKFTVPKYISVQYTAQNTCTRMEKFFASQNFHSLVQTY